MHCFSSVCNQRLVCLTISLAYTSTARSLLVRFNCNKFIRLFFLSNLKIHMLLHTGEKRYECSECGKKFTQSGGLKVHMRLHTGERPYECSECGKKFAQSCSLQVHMRMHTGERPYECSVCGKKFARPSGLQVHLRMHTGEKPYQCSECGKKFTQPSSLKVHMRIHTQKMPYQCSECGKKFRRSSNLQVHMRIHTRETPYECKVCGKKFARSGGLQIHTRVHTGEKPYQCSECGKKFTQPSSLKAHMRIHTQKMPYQCSECGRKFRRSSNLQVHMRIHTRETPYECKVCGKKFAGSGGLQFHTRVHTGEKPYQCSECGKKFTQPGNLNVHMRIHTGERPYQRSHQKGKKYHCEHRGEGLDVGAVARRHQEVHTREDTIAQKHTDLISSASSSESNSSGTHLSVQTSSMFSDRSVFTFLSIPSNGVCSSSAIFSMFNHPNIAVTYGVTVSTCSDMLVMEKVVTSLSDVLADSDVNDEMNVRDRVDISYGIVCAVDYLHHQVGIIHGYISPTTIFITSRLTAKLLDPAASCLVHNKICQRAESYEEDLHQLICLLIKLYDSCSQFSSVCLRLCNMISRDEINKPREKCVSTTDLLELIDELRQNDEYSCSSRRRELSLKIEVD
ncbi:zinc finger protein 883-like isoform X1 [Corticium candelabrum]|uniref:zinc finger protein 883-like isoform X1 n=2 Tax=Corticium candelabrum TaxID=121492 RepID=UPI002E253CBE|nr:zinc finger protein 883-like isoform X1 [Corticium candelabrum]